MRKYIALILVLLCVVSLVGCAKAQAAEAQKKLMALEAPPTLTVSCGEETTEAVMKASVWHTSADSTGIGSISASLSRPAMAAPENLPVLSLTASAPFTGCLQWELLPDEITVTCWAKEDRAKVNAEGEPISAVKSGDGYEISLKNGNFVYEIVAKWNSVEDYGGSATYRFETK